MSKRMFFWMVFTFAVSFSILMIQTIHAEPPDVIPDHYIVVFKESVADHEEEASDDLTRRHGLGKGHVYRHALKGFAAVILPSELDAVKADPRVAFVSEDHTVHTMDRKVQTTVPTIGQTLPTGIDRVNAEVSRTGGKTGLRSDGGGPVDVAVIDTGIDLTHPDLVANIAGNVNFINPTKTGNDDNGHGSHVSGTIAAIDNTQGVVGVAPNARLWAVKVLDRNGFGTWSSVIGGIDWVTASRSVAGREPIEVANMSLGGSGSDDGNCGNTNGDPLHQAICKSVAAGVTYVVAAGNSAGNAALSAPAAYKEVITVSALADSDGKAGGLGPPTSYGADDTFATFSNFGAAVDLIAPGVNIYSTYKKGGYATLSGTSMATPHVTGAAALYIAANTTATPAEVQSGLIATGVLDWNTLTDRDLTNEPRVDACRASGLTCPTGT